MPQNNVTRRLFLAGLLQALAGALAACAAPRTPEAATVVEQGRVVATYPAPAATARPTNTATSTATPTIAPTATATATHTATPTLTPVATATPTPAATSRPPAMLSSAARAGRLSARPLSPPAGEPAGPGLHPLRLGAERDGFLYVPKGYDPRQPAPLLVLFHGAAGYATDMTALFEELADQEGFILLAPDSRGRTWDVVHESFGPDIEFLDHALSDLFGHFAVDASRVAVAGFSDGATYALAVGLTNGDLFGRVVAFSPGKLVPGKLHGKPSVYISHGIDDPVLRIGWSSRAIVPKLRKQGYDVRYHEFEGGHGVPEEIAGEAFGWLSGSGAGRVLPGRSVARAS